MEIDRPPAPPIEIVSLADRPDLFESAFDVGYLTDEASVFMQGNMIGLLTRATRLASRWPDLVRVGLVDGEVVARSVGVPFRVDHDDRVAFPDGGWDQVSIWAAEDALDGVVPDTVCALEIAVEPARRGAGIASAMLLDMLEHAAAAGFARLVAPLRPPGKSAEPAQPIETYCGRRRDDGMPEDWWLRLHERVGGRMMGIARHSATVQARLDTWRHWTGLPFDRPGWIAVPGALVPVQVSVIHDLAVYVEPNVWYEHRLDGADT